MGARTGRCCVLSFFVLLAVRGASAEAERKLAPPAPIPEEREAAAELLARWLDTGDDRAAAWGAWEAGERGLAGLRTRVAGRLGREAVAAGEDRRLMLKMVLLDAAVRLRADVPSSALVPLLWVDAEGVATYLCFRRAGEDHVRVFAALDEASAGGRAWFAVGGCLFEARSPDLAARLLGGWTIERMLRVWDRDGPYSPFRRPSGSVPGDGFPRVPDGYPPIPQRRLSVGAFHDWDRLVGGPFPVHGARYVFEGTTVHFGYAGGDPQPDVARHGWLAAWLHDANVPPLPPWDLVDVKWSGGEQAWQRVGRAAVLEVHDRWRSWRDALVGLGLLSDAAARSLAPRIDWEVRDERRLRRRPIPVLPDVEFDPRLPAAGRRPAGERR